MQPKHVGRILAAIGLVLIVSAPFTWVITTPAIALGKVVLGLVFLAVYLATNFGELGQFASSRGTFFFGVSAVSTVVLVGLLAALNYLAVKHPVSWDLTKNRIHTLAPDTVKTLEGLKEDVRALAVYRPGDQGYDSIHDLFTRYQARSKRFEFEFVDYAKDPLKVTELGVKENGPRVVVRVGATEARFQELTEEALTNAIVKVTHASTKKVYVVTGHGESDPDDSAPAGLSEVKKRMEPEGLKVEKLNLATTADVPADAQVVIVAGPQKAFQAAEADSLRKYLAAGGRAMLMLEPRVKSGLEELLTEYNVEADDVVVVDPVSRLFGTSPTVPVVQNYNAESPIVRDFQLNTVFPTARSLTVLHTDKPAQATPVALTMPTAWGETKPDREEVQRDEGEKGGAMPLVVSVTLDTKAAAGKRSDEARLVVAGDRDFATNKFRGAVGNEDLFLNCLNWLAEQTERITIRPRTRDSSRLYLTEAQRAGIFFVAIDIMPVTLLALGLAVWMVRRSK